MNTKQSHLIDKTIQEWQSYSAEPLSPQDAEEIIRNMSGFFETLNRWHQLKERKNEKQS